MFNLPQFCTAWFLATLPMAEVAQKSPASLGQQTSKPPCRFLASPHLQLAEFTQINLTQIASG
jgi:hypothetical protein